MNGRLAVFLLSMGITGMCLGASIFTAALIKATKREPHEVRDSIVDLLYRDDPRPLWDRIVEGK